MIYVKWRELILIILNNNIPYQIIEMINRACAMTGKSQVELEKLDYPNKCSNSIFECICKKCPSLGMCYDGLKIME